MKSLSNLLNGFLLYPFLFSIYPVLFLYSHNMDQIPVKDIFNTMIILILTTCLIFLLLKHVLRDKVKSGLIIFIILLFFFSFKYLFVFLPNVNDKLLLSIYLGIIILFSYLIGTTKRNLSGTTYVINIFVSCLIIINCFNILIYNIELYGYDVGLDETLIDFSDEKDLSKKDDVPNIYYLVVDTYAREDILKNVYEYDNSEFLSSLREKGFFVADKSRANYSWTHTSIPSSLNMGYLQNIMHNTSSVIVNGEKRCNTNLPDLLKNNMVSLFLKNYGYNITVFSNDVIGECAYADRKIYTCPLNQFEISFIKLATPIEYIFGDIFSFNNMYAYQFLNQFNLLKKITKSQEPFFVFCKFNGLHTPLVFGQNGEFQTPVDNNLSKEAYRKAYIDQLIFINKKLTETIDYILANSVKPPIIILQSDHGPLMMVDMESFDENNNNFKERMSILNAFYLPGYNGEKLPDDITPVNTFRFIFNAYFKTDFPILDNKVYFAPFSFPYEFIDVTNKTM